MAIQVSYLESKLYPSWVQTKSESVSSFRGNIPTAASHSTVSAFTGNWKFPAIPSRLKSGLLDLPRGTGVEAGKGAYPDWPRLTAKPNLRGGFLPEPSGAPVAADKGGYQDWPAQKVTRSLVKSGPGEIPGKGISPKSTDRWAEIGQLRFEISIDGIGSLGQWSKIDGLGMKVEVGEHRTGDGMNYRWTEMGHTTYQNVKLTRAATSAGCAMVLAWLEICQFNWKRGMTAQIQGTPLWRWADESSYFKVALIDVMPVSWTGPQFAADGKLAMESLELAHSGFLSVTPLPGDAKASAPQKQPLPPERKEPTPLSPPPPRTIDSMIDALNKPAK